MSTVCVKRVANTRSHWIIAGDANMEPSDFAEVFLSRKQGPESKPHREDAQSTVLRAQEEQKLGKR